MRLIFFFLLAFQLKASYLDYVYENRETSSNSFGQSGLIQIPSADIKPEGSIGLTFNKNNIYKIGTLTVSPFDWMEASYFYYRPSDLFWGGTPGLYLDKGFNVKFNKKIPFIFNTNVAIGLDDFAGTGLFSREYFAFTSNLNYLKVTAGIGWGKYNGQNQHRNPLSKISNKFDTREGFELQAIYETGRPSTDKWFRGPVGYFGGAEIFLPKSKGIKLKVEYDPFNYMDFSCCGEGYGTRSIELRSKDSNINYGISIPVRNFVDLDISYIKGNQFNVAFTIGTNFLSTKIKKKKKKPPTFYKSIEEEKGTKNVFYRDLLSNMNKNGYFLQYANLKDETLDIVIQNSQYRSPVLLSSYAANLARKVANENNIKTESISISQMNAGMPLNKIILNSSNLDSPSKYNKINKMNVRTKSLSQEEINLYEFAPRPIFPFYTSDFDYQIASHAGSPEQFLYKGLVLNFNNEIQFSRRVHLNSKISYLTEDDFDEKISRPDSALPHVRSEVVNYLQESDLYVDHMFLSLYKPYGSDMYSKFSIGILETMYGGFGSEFLYTPFNKNLSIGLNIHKVFRRDYDRKFDFLDYSTFTGHLETSYFHDRSNILFNLSYGKYLAGDRGYTFDLSRLFDSGLRTGFYFTRTNVSFELFGEGSFDKGFYFNIPFDIFSNNYSRGSLDFRFAPLTRDGGQKLFINRPIRGIIFNSNNSTINRYWNDNTN